MAARGDTGDKSEKVDSALSENEQDQVDERRRLSALTVFAIIRREAKRKCAARRRRCGGRGSRRGWGCRPRCWRREFSIARSPGWREPVEYLGYALGFVLVILGRLQLFTENTLTVVLPLLSEPSRGNFLLSARLWLIVLVANLVGTFVTALVALTIHTAAPEQLAAMIEVSRQAATVGGWEALARAIPAGFYMAAIVWMLPSAKGFEFFVIVLFAWLIAAGGFGHVVAGSTEMFMLLLSGEISAWSVFAEHLAPALAGNVIGGTGLFALLAYAQIKAEI